MWHIGKVEGKAQYDEKLINPLDPKDSTSISGISPERECRGLLFDILDPYERFILFVWSILEKCGMFWKNGRFSGRIWPDWGNTTWADMAGLGKYHMGGYGQIGVYRVNIGTIQDVGR